MPCSDWLGVKDCACLVLLMQNRLTASGWSRKGIAWGIARARLAADVCVVNRAPQIADLGEEGRESWLELELKLVADVGIIGVPNAGKSTLLSVITAG